MRPSTYDALIARMNVPNNGSLATNATALIPVNNTMPFVEDCWGRYLLPPLGPQWLVLEPALANDRSSAKQASSNSARNGDDEGLPLWISHGFGLSGLPWRFDESAQRTGAHPRWASVASEGTS
jgi:hypothetical protein